MTPDPTARRPRSLRRTTRAGRVVGEHTHRGWPGFRPRPPRAPAAPTALPTLSSVRRRYWAFVPARRDERVASRAVHVKKLIGGGRRRRVCPNPDIAGRFSNHNCACPRVRDSEGQPQLRLPYGSIWSIFESAATKFQQTALAIFGH
jgi:hypothetical protein